jgi:predicted outer membrane repeat protein
MVRITIAVAMAAALLLSAASAATYLVKPDGTGDFPTIQEAIDAAAGGDEIQLGDGIFTGPGNRDIDFRGKAVAVRSASGDPDSCIIDVQASAPLFRRGFIFQTGESGQSVLQGVTIKNGNVLLPVWPWRGGGAIRCRNASPTIGNCKFVDNQAHGGGGGIACEDGSAPLVTSCRFEANEGGRGGGILCTNGAHPCVIQCTFAQNQASSYGGAIWCDASAVQITACTFAGNGASEPGSSVACTGGSVVAIQSSILAFGASGEAVYCDGTSTASLGCADLYGNTGGDWVGFIADQAGVNGNFSADPCFCDPENDDFTLWNYSPCAQVGCGTIGAWPVACWDAQGIVDSDASRAARLDLLQVSASPNPFSEITSIRFASPTPGAVRVGLFDLAGREVRSFVVDGTDRGSPLTWDGRDHAGMLVSAGVYWVRASQGDREATTRVLVLR